MQQGTRIPHVLLHAAGTCFAARHQGESHIAAAQLATTGPCPLTYLHKVSEKVRSQHPRTSCQVYMLLHGCQASGRQPHRHRTAGHHGVLLADLPAQSQRKGSQPARHARSTCCCLNAAQRELYMSLPCSCVARLACMATRAASRQVLTPCVQVSLGTEFMWNWNQREASAAVGYDYTLRQARLRGRIDSDGKIAALVEERINAGINFLLSAEIDHAKKDYKFGFGLTVGE